MIEQLAQGTNIPFPAGFLFPLSSTASAYEPERAGGEYSAILVAAAVFVLLSGVAAFFYYKGSALKKDFRQLESMAANIPGCVRQCRCDDGLTFLYYSEALLRMTGYTRDEIKDIFNDRFVNMVYGPDRGELIHRMHQRTKTESVEIQYRLVRKGGSLIWILEKGQFIEESRKAAAFCGIIIDITSQKETMEELILNNERYKIVMDQTDSTIFEYNIADGGVTHLINSLNLFGGQPAAAPKLPGGVLAMNIVHPDDVESFRDLFRKVQEGAQNAEGEFRLKNEQDEFLWYEIKITTIFDDSGIPVRAIGCMNDITSQKQETQILMQKAQRDELTGLLNRAATQSLIEDSLKSGSACALFMIDVDHFKNINDSLGHMFGDMVLAETGNSLKNLFRASDIVGRVGGDEFMVLLKDMDDTALILDKARMLHQCMNKTVSGQNDSCSISGSIGISLYPKDGSTYAELYAKADAALYSAKRSGRNRFALFHSGMEMEPSFRNTLRSTL